MDKTKLTFLSALRRNKLRPIGTLLVLFLALFGFPALLPGQSPVAATKEPSASRAHSRQSVGSGSASGGEEYVIDADDVLDVYVVDVPQLTRDYRVSPDGTIVIPLLSSPLTAEGLTLDQLSAVISAKLRTAGLVSHPHVIVTVKSSQAHAVAISGAVQSPQIYPILGPTTLLDVLSQAGGLAPDAGGTAIITRGNAAARASWLDKGSGSAAPAGGTIKVDLRKLLATGDPSLNVTIYPGDKVTVQRAGVIYVVGAVKRPGGFPMSSGRERMTVLEAVALGEGLKPTALQKKAMIIRRGKQFPDGREEIPVNLKNVLAGHAADAALEANDILFIPDSASKRALRRGAEAAVQIATGLVIWGRY
ncbi:MAG: SLBB domain-containing protein [Acidobacteriota bacterium]